MEPTKSRPARRRLTEDELRAALANIPLTIVEVQEITGHNTLDALSAYRRVAQSPTDTPDRTPQSFSTGTLRATGAALARQAGTTPQLADEVTGHRGDSTGPYLRRQEPFRPTHEVTGEQ